MELEVLWKRLRDDAQKLKEEKTKLDGMIESHNELIMEIAKEARLNCMGEVVEDEDEHEDDDDEGDAAAPPTVAPTPIAVPPAAAREEIVINDEDSMEMVPK
jgi:hypothetical protein